MKIENQPHSRSDLKKFCVQLLYFILPPLLLLYPADILISTQLKKSNNFAAFEYPIWNVIFEKKVDAEVFIYGSSRAWVHIDPEMIEKKLGKSAYNFGVDGHNFGLQQLRHEMLRKYNNPPKIILHSVDMFTLTKQKDLYNFQQFLPYLLYNTDLEKTLKSYNGFDSKDYKIPMLRYRLALNAITESMGQMTGLDANLPVRIKGFQAQDRVWDGKFEEVKNTLTAISVPIDPKMVRLFDNYLADCKKRKIAVVLIYTPEYIEGQMFETNRDDVISMYKNMSKKYDIPYLDYSNDSITLDKKYFYNATHMNKVGTTAFNAKLTADLKKLAIFN